MLKPCHGHPTTKVTPLPEFLPTSSLNSQPSRILDSYQVVTAAGEQEELLVEWEGQPSSEATWELKTSLRQSYPNYDLEDKILLRDPSNVIHSQSTKPGQIPLKTP